MPPVLGLQEGCQFCDGILLHGLQDAETPAHVFLLVDIDYGSSITRNRSFWYFRYRADGGDASVAPPLGEKYTAMRAVVQSAAVAIHGSRLSRPTSNSEG